MNVPNDIELRGAFARLARREMAALEGIFCQWSEPLHNYAYALTGSPDEADDIVADTMARMARLGWRLRLVRHPKAYLFAAIRNGVHSRARRSQREAGLQADPPRTEAGSEESVVVREAVLRLPREQREVVVLRIWGGLTFEEIGRTVGVPLNTAASRYRHALGKLREALEDDNDGSTQTRAAAEPDQTQLTKGHV